jgi:hypothetical protein
MGQPKAVFDTLHHQPRRILRLRADLWDSLGTFYNIKSV